MRGLIRRTCKDILPCGVAPISDSGHRIRLTFAGTKPVAHQRQTAARAIWLHLSRTVAMMWRNRKRPRKWEGLWVRGLLCNFNTPILRLRHPASSDPGHNR